MATPVQPLVSCIIPTKDRPHLISRAITSVLKQSYSKIEVIVIDDSTNSNTKQVISQFGAKVIYIKNGQSKGAPYSRNIGLAEAKGDIISFLDDDDVWMPNKIEAQLKLLSRYPIVSCNYTTVVNGKMTYIRRPKLVTYEKMLYYNYLGSCSCVIAAADVVASCYFDENIKLGQDWDMWLSIMKKNAIKQATNVDEYLVDYNSGEHSRISNVVKPMPVMLSIYDKYRDDHSDFTTRMFYLYNMMPADNSLLMGALREIAKLKSIKFSLFYALKNLIKRYFRHIDVY
jgi:glycosyltransferase involved in cell wall biosynthesis